MTLKFTPKAAFVVVAFAALALYPLAAGSFGIDLVTKIMVFAIFALSLEPELMSIAGLYRTSEIALPGGVRGKPAQVRLGGEPGAEKLIIEALKT